MTRWVIPAFCILLGCTSSTSSTLSNTVETGKRSTNALYAIEIDHLGPITKDTPANLTALRELFAGEGLTVKPVNRSGTEFHVFQADHLVLYVIPNDNGTLFNVHVPSAKVEIAQHPEWRIGSPFDGYDTLTDCECWGQHPMCFKKGEHVAVGFTVDCGGLDTPKERRETLKGVPIQRAVWSPSKFGYDDETPNHGTSSSSRGSGWSDPDGAGIPRPDPDAP